MSSKNQKFEGRIQGLVPEYKGIYFTHSGKHTGKYFRIYLTKDKNGNVITKRQRVTKKKNGKWIKIPTNL